MLQDFGQESDGREDLGVGRSAWAPLIAQLYEVDPLVCPKCAHEMRVLAVITDPVEVKKILRHLVNIGCPPHGLDPSVLN